VGSGQKNFELGCGEVGRMLNVIKGILTGPS
jgi:hypothetical protein